MRCCSQGGDDSLSSRKNLGHPKPVANLHPKRIFLRDSSPSKPLLIKLLQGCESEFIWEHGLLKGGKNTVEISVLHQTAGLLNTFSYSMR